MPARDREESSRLVLSLDAFIELAMSWRRIGAERAMPFTPLLPNLSTWVNRKLAKRSFTVRYSKVMTRSECSR